MSDAITTQPQSTPQPPPQNSGGITAESRAEIMALAGGLEESAPAPAPASSPAATPAPAATKAPEPVAKTETGEDDDIQASLPKSRKAEAAKPADKPTTDEDPAAAYKTPAALRGAYNQAKGEVAKLRAEMEALKAAAPTPAAKLKVEETPEYKALVAEATAAKAEREKLAEDIRFADYRKSPEFRDKYQKPLNDAFQSAIETLAAVTVTGDDGVERVAGENELVQLARLNPLDRAKQAKAMFGDSAIYVLEAIRPVTAAWKAQQDAIKDFETKAPEWEAQREAKRNESRDQARAIYDGALESITSAAPDIYGFLPDADPGAAEFNQRLVGVKKLIEIATKNPAGLPIDRVLKTQAAVSARAIAYERAAYDADRLRTENAELRAKLAAHETADPAIGGHSGNGSGAPSAATSYRDEIMALAGAR